jgi:spore coat protein U-like protein
VASLAAKPLHAATATTTFQVRITIQASCIINSAGTLDFGTNGVLAANVDASSTLSVQCTASTPYTISLDPGTGSGATVAVRKMTGPASATINYSLYQDGARSLVWGQTISTDTVAGTGTGSAQSYTVFGRVPSQSTPGAGLYTDTITVTVTY